VPEAWRRPEEEEVVAVGTISSDVQRWWVPRRCGGGNRYGHERERESVMWACGARHGRVPAGLSPLTFLEPTKFI
jgi:hypothetical protein